MALARLRTVSFAVFSASSVLMTSWCSALISTPMYCAAWLRADSMALSLPSSSDEAPPFAPEKYSASWELGAFTSHAGGFGEDAVFTAAFSPPQASSTMVAREAALLRTRGLRRGGLLREPPRIALQAGDVVDLAEHVPVGRERVRLVDHRFRLLVVAGVLVGEAEVPVALRDLRRLQLDVRLRRLGGVVERALRLLPVAALRPADPALELRDVRVLLEVRVLVLLVRDDGSHEPLDDRAPRAVLQLDAVGGLRTAVGRAVGVVAALLVRPRDDQPACRDIDDLEVGADVSLALDRVRGVDDVLLVLVPVFVGDLAVAGLHVPEDQRARGDHLPELRRGVGIRQVGRGEPQLAHDLLHVLPVDDGEAVGVDQRLLQRVRHRPVSGAAHVGDR